MGQQTITSAFRAGPPDPTTDIAWNVLDQWLFGTNGWTPGATLIDQIPIQQPLVGAWSIIAYTISFGLYYWPSGAVPMYAKFGNILAALVGLPSTVPLAAAPNNPWVVPALPQPPSPSGYATLWNGQSDPAPPSYALGNPAMPATVQVSLPLPVQQQPGDSISIGLWIQPILGEHVALGVTNATYTIVYDDGQPPTQGWTVAG